MPHIVLKGKNTVEDIFKGFKQIFIKNENSLLRTLEVYLERGKNAVLIDSIAIEANKKTTFLVMITGREDGVVIRLYPRLEAEKTNGLKQILAEIAKQLMQTFPDFSIAETNLSDYLK